jgi:CO/xanthine dehydrogenase FAD-binding subunit
VNLDTITEVKRPTSADQITQWREGYAWLAGGTWLFSEPQVATDTLIDLDQMHWPPLQASSAGLDIAATCRIAELYRFVGPQEWRATPLVRECCNALLASFKIWNAATVGGNVCMSLPAGAMISLTTALQGVCVIWDQSGGRRRIPVEQFVTGNHENALREGELLRAIEIPLAAMRAKTSFRQISLSPLGRSAVLLIGALNPEGSFMLTITASTIRPLRLEFPMLPSRDELQARIREEIPDSLYFDDVHGDPGYRRHMTYLFADEIRRELSADPGDEVTR